ncbi:hypothetical protein DAEQUDRAFT_729593 [Daedalea quercina L-15889]|uniref:Uncharacterized protein n=1 Tax=Daedalea quercina L-15889 TaxID=1314783 RepID=A0A165NI17_9APHY|nr:hypothetical protein DAEQUDRAFT_729593 [Daedalea quercina L-15889]
MADTDNIGTGPLHLLRIQDAMDLASLSFGLRSSLDPFLRSWIAVALQSKQVLLRYRLNAIEVEIRESRIISSPGPQLLKPALDVDPTVDLRDPFTFTLGLPICSRSEPFPLRSAG